MSFKSILLKFILALPGVIFWFWYFAPPPADGRKDWVRFGIAIIASVLSAAGGFVSLVVAARKERTLHGGLSAA